MAYSHANGIQPNNPVRKNSENRAEGRFTSSNSKGQFQSSSFVPGSNITISEDLKESLKMEAAGQHITPIKELNPAIPE